MAKNVGRWLLVVAAFLAGAIIIPYTIHAIFLLCLAILPFDLNWLPDTRIFRSALGGFLAVWLPMLAAPSHKRRVAVGALVLIVAGFSTLAWLDTGALLELGRWTIVVELVSPALTTILALVLHRHRGQMPDGQTLP